MKNAALLFTMFCALALAPLDHVSAATAKISWYFPKPSSSDPNGLGLTLNSKMYPVVRKGVSAYQPLASSEFESYSIPKEALLAAYSWHAGYGDVIYVVQKGPRLEVCRREMDESETSRFPVKKILILNLE